MTKRVLDVGQCAADHWVISRMIRDHFDAEVVQTHGMDDTLEKLKGEQFDLVLINRKLDADYSDGVEIIRRMKETPELANVPIMLVSNYPEHQRIAVEAGALTGFGKAQCDDPATREKLSSVLV